MKFLRLQILSLNSHFYFPILDVSLQGYETSAYFHMYMYQKVLYVSLNKQNKCFIINHKAVFTVKYYFQTGEIYT